jgi:hypothetical protein
MKLISKVLVGSAIVGVAVLGTAGAANAAATVPNVTAKPGDSITVRPSITTDSQGFMTFTVPTGARITDVAGNKSGTVFPSCTKNAAFTVVKCGATNGHYSATNYLIAYISIDEDALPGDFTGNVTVQRAANDTGRVAFDVDYDFRIAAVPPKVTGTTYGEDGAATVSGTGTPGLTITVHDSTGTTLGTVPVEADGSWSYVMPVGYDGLAVVTQGDDKGNGSSGTGVVITPPLDTPIVDPKIAGGAAVAALAAGTVWMLRRRQQA